MKYTAIFRIFCSTRYIFQAINSRFQIPILRTFSSITREICVQIKNKVHHVNQLIEPDLMMYIHMTFSLKKTLHATHSTKLTLPSLVELLNNFSVHLLL